MEAKQPQTNLTIRLSRQTVIFPTYGQSGAIWKPDLGCRVCKTYTFINSNLYFLQKLKTEQKISNAALRLLL